MASSTFNDFPVQKELHRFSSIVTKHSNDLDVIRETLDPVSQHVLHRKYDAVSLKLNPFEFVSDFELICTENELVSKTAIALTALCKEMLSLVEEAENEYCIPLFLYGKEHCKDKECDDAPELKFSKLLSVLHCVCNYIQYVKKVVVNVSLQMNVLHSNDKKTTDIHAGTAHFQVVFEHLGRVLSSLVIIDEIIKENPLIKEHSLLYQKLLKSVHSDPSSFSCNKEDLNNLKSFVQDIDRQVLKGDTLKMVLTDIVQKSPLYCSNGCLREEVLTVILGWSSQVEDTSSESWLWENKRHILSLTALCIYYSVIFDNQDKKIGKTLISLYKKVPCILISVCHAWIGEEYIRSHFPSIYSVFDLKSLDGLLNFRKQYLYAKTQSLPIDAEAASMKVIKWSTQMEIASRKSASTLSKQDLNHRASLIWQGFILASNFKETAESVLGLSTTLEHPMSKASALSLCKITEALKAVEETYHLNTAMLAETLPHLRQFLGFQILLILKNTKERTKKERNLSKHLLDVLSSLSLAEQAISGNGNSHRLLIARVALSMATQDRVISDEDLTNLLSLLRRLNLSSDILGKIRKVSSTDFIYNHQILFKIYLQDYIENVNTTEIHRLQYMLAAVNDTECFLHRPKDLSYRISHLELLHEKIENILRQELLDKLCEKVETELRLRSHSHLHNNTANPFGEPEKLLGPLINLSPLKVFNSFICIKDYVELYLQKTFYNLTALAPHDGATYERMRNLGLSHFDLVAVDSQLPAQTLNQGVDVLDIMRNINAFVQNYHYNMNQQFFVEIESNNKHLSTVSIKHIANSIRTHGSGVINTAVNFTYQFLRKKFYILSQFLYDEHIKSRLLKDLQYWKEVKDGEKSFPFIRAQKFNKGIKSLGVSSKGISYLDQFRILVTQIGNTIGYIRLVRSGCLQCVSSAIQFLPDLQSVSPFKELCCSPDFVDSKTFEAAENLDEYIYGLASHFEKETDYFKIMVDAFSPVLRDSKNAHLKNFYLIVPAMSINYIDYFITAKESIPKKYREGTAFTDDGFAIGVTYILNVLDQTEYFNSLHWWTSVRKYFLAEKEKVNTETSRTKSGDVKLQQALSLSLSRISECQRSFEFLSFSITSARVFFQTSNHYKKLEI